MRGRETEEGRLILINDPLCVCVCVCMWGRSSTCCSNNSNTHFTSKVRTSIYHGNGLSIERTCRSPAVIRQNIQFTHLTKIALSYVKIAPYGLLQT